MIQLSAESAERLGLLSGRTDIQVQIGRWDRTIATIRTDVNGDVVTARLTPAGTWYTHVESQTGTTERTLHKNGMSSFRRTYADGHSLSLDRNSDGRVIGLSLREESLTALVDGNGARLYQRSFPFGREIVLGQRSAREMGLGLSNSDVRARFEKATRTLITTFQNEEGQLIEARRTADGTITQQVVREDDHGPDANNGNVERFSSSSEECAGAFYGSGLQ